MQPFIGFSQSVNSYIDSTVCANSLPLVWNDSIFYEAGIKHAFLSATAGYDSIVTMTLTVMPLPEVNHTQDTIIALGDSASLWMTGLTTLTWLAEDGSPLSTANGLTVSPTGNRCYYLTGILEGPNVVANGDFEAGDTLFNSGYSFNANLWDGGNYFIGYDASTCHNNFLTWFDHTSGSGKYMIVNGATTAGVNIWSQSVGVTSHTDYTFSVWVCNVSQVNANNERPDLKFTVNGTEIGNVVLDTSYTGHWTRYYQVWNSGNTTTANLAIVNQNTNYGGNDFGIDDIEFRPVEHCPYIDTICVRVATYYDTTVCDNNLPVSWRGHTFDNTDSIAMDCTTATGDSIVMFLYLDVVNSYQDIWYDTLVENSLPWSFLDSIVDSSMLDSNGSMTQFSFDYLFTNMAGCDSVIELRLTVFNNVTTYLDTLVCSSAFPVEWCGDTFLLPETHYLELMTAHGADSLVVVSVGSFPTVTARGMISDDSMAWLSGDSLLTGCRPFRVFFCDSSLNAASCRWLFGDGDSSTVGNSSHLYSEPGLYSLSLVATSIEGCVDSMVMVNTIEVAPTPVADFEWKPERPANLSPKVELVNRTEPYDSLTEIRWYFFSPEGGEEAIDSSTLFSPHFEWPMPMALPDSIRTVSLLAGTPYHGINGNDMICYDTTLKEIHFANIFLQFPTAVTPNGDGINDRWFVVGLVENGYYPMNRIRIYDRWGRLVFNADNIASHDDDWDPNATNSPDGTYFLRFDGQGPYGHSRHNGIIEVER